MTTKETVRAILDRLPDNCSVDDVLYLLCVVQAVARRDAAASTSTSSALGVPKISRRLAKPAPVARTCARFALELPLNPIAAR
jgi:hypothetical protein